MQCLAYFLGSNTYCLNLPWNSHCQSERLSTLLFILECIDNYFLPKQVLGKRTKFVRDLVREVVGFSPYEKRVMELLKNSKDKRARKVAKKRVCWTIEL